MKPEKKRRGRIPYTVKSIIESYRVTGALTDPYGSYTGVNALEETEADDMAVADDIETQPEKPVQDADDL